MSSSSASSPSSSSPTDTSSSSTDYNSSSDSDVTGGAQYYNYFFLLLGVAFLIVFLLLLYFQRRRKIKNARLEQHGRAALVQDVSQFSPTAGLWSWRSPSEPSRRLNRTRSVCDDSILEAGLDERGEAPPPYNTAAADKAPSMSRTDTVRPTEAEGWAMRQLPTGERMICRLPAGYHENGGSQERRDVPARPAAVVPVTERLSEADLEEQPGQDAHASQIPPRNAGRWGSMRRLMSSTDGSA